MKDSIYANCGYSTINPQDPATYAQSLPYSSYYSSLVKNSCKPISSSLNMGAGKQIPGFLLGGKRTKRRRMRRHTKKRKPKRRKSKKKRHC